MEVIARGKVTNAYLKDAGILSVYGTIGLYFTLKFLKDLEKVFFLSLPREALTMPLPPPYNFFIKLKLDLVGRPQIAPKILRGESTGSYNELTGSLYVCLSLCVCTERSC